MSSSDNIIEVRNISKTYFVYDNPKDRLKQLLNPKKRYYTEFKALDDVSFNVKKGGTVGLIGKNGSGKSTVLQIIAGTLLPTKGSVNIKGKVVALLELGSGFNLEFTGRENVYLNGTIFGITKEVMDTKFKEIEEFADIGSYIDQPVKTYSSGMFARLAFSVAINMDPDILIVDEILAVGDIAFQAKCVSKLRKMKDNGLTLLFVSHSVDALKSLCTEAVLLEKGKVVSIGTSEEITNMYLASIREDMNKQQENSLNDVKEDKVECNEKQKENTYGTVKGFKYGTGEVFFERIAITDENGNEAKCFKYGDNAVLKCTIISKQNFNNVNLSFLVRDITGIDLFGTTMFDEKINLINMKQNIPAQIDFKFPISLRSGSYSVSVAVNTVSEEDYSDVYLYQQIDAAASFEVIRDLDRPVHYKVHFPVTIKVEGE